MLGKIVTTILLVSAVFALIACETVIPQSPAAGKPTSEPLPESTTPVIIKKSTDSLSPFQVTGLALGPGRTNPGAQVIVTANILNTGDTGGRCVAELAIDNIVEDVQEKNIPAGETHTFNFCVSRNEPGIYEVSCGGLVSKFEVIDVIVPAPQDGFAFNAAEQNIPDVPDVPSCCSPDSAPVVKPPGGSCCN